VYTGSARRFEQSLREIAITFSILDQTNLSTNIVTWLRETRHGNHFFVFDDIGPEFYPKSPQATAGNAKAPFKSGTILAEQVSGATLEATITNALESDNAEVALQHPATAETIAMLRLQCPKTQCDKEIPSALVHELDVSMLAITIAAAYIEE
jgi:hypothetical protein